MKLLQQAYQEAYEQAVLDGNEIHHSDKGTNHSYINVYEKILEPYRNRKINFLEIGVNKGYSMLLWQKYFTDSTFYGIDSQDIAFYTKDYNYIVADINSSSYISEVLGDTMFDVIIDDGSHKIEDQVHALNLLYPRLKEDGLFVVEDVDNIDASKHLFEKYNPTIYDNREQQNRWDDVLVIINK
jgi:hypothetical protein